MRASSPNPAPGSPPRTVADDGLHAAEIDRLIFAVERWQRDGATVLFITLGDRLLDLPGHEQRSEAREFLKRLTRMQTRAGLPAEWIAVFEVGKETRRGLHLHVLVLGSKDMVRRVRSWSRFRPYMRRLSEAVKVAPDPVGFINAGGYLIEEAGDPRFAWPEGSGGGDRVIPSPTLKAAMLAEGCPDWQRSTSRDLRPRPPRVRTRIPTKAATDFSEVTTRAPYPIEQKIAAAAAPPPMIEMVAKPVQLHLFADDDLPESRADADLPDAIRAVRIDAGITQTALAKRIGVRQAHLANVERHHDRLGRATRRAARYLLQRIAA